MAHAASYILLLAKARHVARVPCVAETPFEYFATARSLGMDARHKFLRFVEHSGGSYFTDLKTLQLLFGIWEEKGRP
jgi:hypothetical protein